MRRVILALDKRTPRVKFSLSRRDCPDEALLLCGSVYIDIYKPSNCLPKPLDVCCNTLERLQTCSCDCHTPKPAPPPPPPKTCNSCDHPIPKGVDIIRYPAIEVSGNTVEFYFDDLLFNMPAGRYLGTIFFNGGSQCIPPVMIDLLCYNGVITSVETYGDTCYEC